MLIVGEGAASTWNATAVNWNLRYPIIRDALVAAGVGVDVMTAEEANALWSFSSSDPLFDSLRTANLTRATMATSVWSTLMMNELTESNSLRRGKVLGSNLPALSMNYARAALVHFGRKFLADPVWKNYYGTSGGRRRKPLRSFR